MKRLLSITLTVLVMNELLTPLSYAFSIDENVVEDVVVESVTEEVSNEEINESEGDLSEENGEGGEDIDIDSLIEISDENGDDEASEGQEDTQDSSEQVPQNDANGTGDVSSGTEGNESEGSYVGNGTGDTQDSSEQVPQNDANGTGDVNNEVDYSQYTSETRVAVLASKLGINWEEDAKYYAQLAGIEEEYRGTAQQNETIRLYLIDHIEEILNGEYESIIAEMKALEQEVLTGDVAEVETGNVLTGDIEDFTGDIEQLTGEVLTGGVFTGDIEISTGDIELLTGEVLTGEILTGDIFTGSAIEAVNETIEEMQAQRAAEITKIWEILNEEVISGQEMYKDVIVSVEAPVASFPEGTQLRIIPIMTKARMDEIKEQLVENTDVTEESELVSFDISFIYVLSGGEEIELQPYTGQTVKVSFNYTYNDALTEADNDSNKELKVYHLEEVVNEKGRKTDEVEVKEVEIKENSEGELVVDAEKFSIYTIVTQQFEEPQLTNTWKLGTDYYEIETKNPNNSSQCITIMDRNLGATMTGQGADAPETSYGYYYQWGNNYGFTTDTAQDSRVTSAKDVSDKSFGEYSGSEFVGLAQWMNPTNRTLWGWVGTTWISSSSSTHSVTSNVLETQGPCPDGWHIPSSSERGLLEQYYGVTRYGDSYGTITVKKGDYTNFVSNYNIPYAGRLATTGKPDSRGTYFFIRSSSRGAANFAISFQIMAQNSVMKGHTTTPGLGLPVRCFKNTYTCKPSASCELLDGTVVAYGVTTGAYQSNIVGTGQSCQTVSLTCSTAGAILQGYSTCKNTSGQTGSVAVGCDLPRGGSVADGESATGYTTSSATCPNTCSSATATCNNGVWSVQNFTGTYTQQSCTTNGVSCDASYTASSQSANGTYDSCTPYTVSSNSCNEQSTVYKLTNCSNGYHTENGTSCTSNSKSVACTQSGKPANSNYVSGTVQVTWNGTWNGGSWSSPTNCAWTCQSGYHTEDNETCISNTQTGVACTSDVPNNAQAINNTYTRTWNGGSWSSEPARTYNGSECGYECISGFHTEDNVNCISNTKQVSCSTGSTPANATPTVVDVTITWNNGSWSTPTACAWTCDPGYTQDGNECKADCNLPRGGTTGHGASVTAYTASSATCPTECSSATATCNNGDWSVQNFTQNYKQQSCTTNGVSCDSSFTLTTTGAHGTYSSCTPYTVSSNSCNEQSTVYKLTSCDAHYHTGTDGHCTIDTYTITWEDGDGQTLKTDTVNWNVVPVYSGANPTKTQDAQYTYTFNGSWSPNPIPATADATYTAQFTPNTRSYTITWLNDDNSQIDTTTVEYGVVPTHASGTKANTAEYTYTFAGWTPNPVAVTGPATYKATFNATKNKYLITFKNRDGAELQSSELEYGATPSYSGTPTRPATDEFTYTFAGWSPEISSVTKAQVYTATYNSITNQYTATINVSPAGWGSVNTGAVKKDYNSNISINGSTLTIGGTQVIPTATGVTAEFTYTFSGWNNTCGSKLTGDCTITAVFKRSTNEYLITFKNRDGIVLKTGMVAYGTEPTAPANPSRPATQQYTYTFTGWSPAIHSVNGAQVYTAVYDSTVNQYTATINATPSGYGTVSPTSVTKDYDEPITINGNKITIGGTTVTATPTASGAQYTYTFVNWTNNCGDTLTDNCTITANFARTTNNYKITIVSSNTNSGTVTTGSITVPYGTSISKAGSTLTLGSQTSTANPKPRTDQYTYTFDGWTDNCGGSTVTKACTITANFSSTVNNHTVIIVSNNTASGTVTTGSITVPYGTSISTGGRVVTIGTQTSTANPKPSNDQYTYTFVNWTNSCGATVTTGCQITANFTSTVNDHTVSITSSNTNSGTVSQSSVSVPYGTSISTGGNTLTIGSNTITATPTPSDDQYTYTFVRWNNSCGNKVVTGCNIEAVFTSTVNNHTVTIVSNNVASGSVSPSEVTVPYGTVITPSGDNLIIGETTVKPTPTTNDAQYTYTFDGWTTNCGGSVVTGCVITGNFSSTVNQYQITFNSNGGSAVASQTKYYGETVTKPADPTRDGYNFSGWYSNEGLTTKYNFTETVTGPLTLYAKWTAKNYAITYVLNGGTVSPANPTSYTIESAAITLTNPTRVGYEFKGWTGTKLNGLTMSVTIPHGSTGDRNYVANWEAKNVKITINHHLQDLNANTNTLLSTYTDYKTLTGAEKADSTITLANYKLTNITGYIYDYGKVNGTTTTTTTVLPDGTRVVDLYYTRNEYSFTLNSAIGATTAGSSTTKSYYFGANITLSGDVSSDCYMWSGWNVVGAPSTSNKKTTFTMPANAVTATPVVTEKVYNIIFNGTTKTSGSTDSMNNVKCTASVTLNANGFDKTGYTFSGWATTSGGAKVYEDQQSGIQTLSTTNNGNVTLYAVWTPNPDTKYQVIHRYLDVNGNRDNSNKQIEDLTGTSDATITPDFISKDGFNDPASKITTGIAADGSTVVNYEYSRKYYTLHFVTTGTTVNDREVIYGGALNVDETSAISGYTFLGWSPNPTGMTMPLNGQTLTATWRANPDTPYKVEHYLERLEGGYYTSPEDTDNLTGTTDTPTKAEAKDYEGFTLSGNIANYQTGIKGNESTVVRLYYTRDSHTITFVKNNGEADYVVTAKYSGDVLAPANPKKTGHTFIGWDTIVPTKMPAQDMVITAQWQINQYTIHFDTDGGTEIPDITLDYDSVIPEVTPPTKTGYTFASWDKEIPTKMPATGTNIKALWTINSYEIRFTDSEHMYDDVVYTGDFNSSTSGISEPSWTKTGYTIHWDKEIPNPMPATGTVITASWIINKYRIKFTTSGSAVSDIYDDYGTVISEEPQTEQYGYTFSGWYYSGEKVNFPYTITAEDKTFVAHWDINQYTITFDSNGGTPVESITRDYNTQVTKPTDPTKTGHTFLGWYYNNTLVNWPHTLTEDRTFTGKWDVNQYTITFDSNGGTAVTPITQDYDTEIIAPKNPSKTGYTFGGWSPALPARMPATGMTVVAQWNLVTYKIDYELYGGTNHPDNRTGYTIETSNFTIQEATRTGYTFLGWTGSNGETAQKTITINKGNYGYRHYYANWSLDTYAITYNMNGGTNNGSNPPSYTYEDDVIILQNPTKTGYIFSGWTGEGITTPTKLVQIPAHSTGPKEYTAVWDLDIYAIYYELDGGDNNPANPHRYTYESGAITLQDPSKTGYTFLGWTGEGITTPTKGVQIPAHSTGNKEYTANWDANVYKLNYVEYGGVLAPNTPRTAIYDIPFTINYPSRTGYTFSGWEVYNMDNVEHTIGSTTTTATSIDSTSATNFKNLTSISGSEVQFKAQWNKNQYNIIYKLDGGKFGDRHPNTATYDDTFYVDNPTKTGYTFSGWRITGMNSVEHTYGSGTTTATSIDNTKEISFKNLHSTTNANVTFTALWTPIGYTITYNLDGGALNEGETNPTKYTIESATIVLKTPSKTGYDFSGWVDGSGNFVRTVTIEQGSIGDRSYTAIYTVHKWSLRFLQDTTPLYSGMVAYGDPIVIPNTGSISKEGYHFTGWTPSSIPATMPDNNLTFSVVWEVNTHTVTYVSEGQTFKVYTGVPYGVSIPQTSITPTKIGHHFVRWTGDVSLTDTMPDRDLTYTAVFERNDYKVTLNANPTSGGSVQGAGTYKYNDSITVTGTANYGFTFSGWKVGDSFVSRNNVYTFTADAQSGITLVAVFDINYYDVSVETSDAKMGTVAGSGRYQYMTQVQLSANNKQGYHFVKWTNSNGDFVSDSSNYTYTVTQDTGFIAVFEPNTDTPYVVNHYKQNVNGDYPQTPTKSETLYGTSDVQVTPDVESYVGFTAPTKQTVTIAATGSTVVNYYYTRNTYTITFNTNEGTPVASITGRYEKPITKPANPSRTGYTFTGWSEPIPDKMPAHDMTINAGWRINQYTIHFDTDGGTEIPDITQDYDTVINKPANPTKEGYTFTGWSEPIPDRMPATGMTITAIWEINQYTITFDTDGGTEIPDITQDYDTVINKPADPTKTGYKFTGWSPSIPTRMPAYSQTITGTWAPRDDTKYLVVHKKQQLDGSYVTGDVYTGQGTTNTNVTPAVKNYDGFTAPGTQTVNIEPDGSRVVIYLYTRNSYTLSFNIDGGTPIAERTLKFEEPIGTIATTTKTGYHLAENVAEAWINYPNGGLMPATGLTLVADWIPNPDTPYTIKHYKQNIDGSYPTDPTETDNLTGETASEFLPKVKDYHGFEAPVVESGTIAADGSTVVELRYRRLTYTVNYNTDGGDAIDSTGVIFGDDIPTPTPHKTGYDFVEWSGLPNPALMPDYELDLTAIWTESKNTPYRVEYWLENIQTGHYTLYTGLDLTGTTNAEVTPVVGAHTGFKSPEPQTTTIKPDGSTLIVYQYTRKSFELSYDTKGGTPVLDPILIKYEDQVITGEVSRPGYTFDRWDNYPADGKMSAGNLKLVAKWTANTNTPYTVNHYLQHLDDTGYDLRYEQTLHGTTDTGTAAAPLDYPGYTALPFEQTNINGDGSAVVNIYYDRDTYKIVYRMAGGDPIATGAAKYDTPLQPILSGLNPTRLGYDFHQWNGLPKNGKMPANDLYLTAEWTARNDTPYTVNHYRENIASGYYTLHETENPVGITDSVITVPIKIYTGFKNPTVQTGKIIAVHEGETGLVIDYYYNRDSFTLTYDENGGTPVTVPNPTPVRYEVVINTGVTTTKTGYIFSGWSNVPEGGKMPAKALTIKAIWEPDVVNYTVEHKLQSIDDESVYELSGTLTQTLTGKSESRTQAVAKDLSGFTAQTITQKKIDPNGTTVVEVKYTRKSYTISFNSKGGTAVESITAKYQSGITAPANPSKTGYTFSGWNPSVPATMPAHDMELMAEWINNKYTVSFNANQGQGATPSVTATYDERFTLTTNGFIRNGYTFSGWAMSENGTKVYNDGQEVNTNLASESGANIVLYAVWDLNTYNIKYNLNGGSVEGNNPTKYDVTSGAFTLINPTRDGYTFEGWTGTDLSSATQTVTIPSGSTGNREYTATWKTITYTIHYNANSGVLADNPSEYTIESETFTINNPTRTGYTFVGWSGTYLNEPTDPLTIQNGSTGNRSYVANWTANNDTEYTVNHYQEQLEGEDKLVDTETLTGTTDTKTNAQYKTYAGFTGVSFEQENINGDKSTVINIHYVRKYYDVTVDGERGIESVTGTGSYKYQQPVTVTVNVKSGYTIEGVPGHYDYNVETELNGTVIRPNIDVITYNITYSLNQGVVTGSNPTTYNVETGFTLINPSRTGYDFTGWTGTDLSEKTMVVTVTTGNIGDRNYVANWTARNDTEYKVIHVYEGIESTPEETLSKTHTGTSDTTVTGQLLPKVGFNNPAEQPVYIKADGTAEITYYYDRTKYTVTYDSNSGVAVAPWTGKYGAEIPRPSLSGSRDGYRFDGWSGATTVPAENTGLVAQWTAIAVNYTVKHMQENANDTSYSEVESDRQILTGITDTNTNAIAKVYSGFRPGVFTNVKINGDGSTVVEVKYDREVYTVTFDSSGGTAVAPITGKYEQNLTAPANPKLSGYTFMGWEPEFPTKMPLNGTGLKAIWEANTGTAYTVEHYLADLSGNYAAHPDYTDELRGTTNTYTAATGRVIEGFTAKDIDQQIIKGDESTVVRVEYDRNVYTVTYDANGGTEVEAWTGKFEAEIPNKATSRSGYDFVEWTGATNVPADDVTVTAVWKVRNDTPYTVKHMQENANDTGYTEVEADRQILTGTTEGYTHAVANQYSGFKVGVFEDAIISGNGSTVVEIRYQREIYDITFDTATGTHVDSISAKYGADITSQRPANPELSGYDFVDWDPVYPSTMPLDGIGLTAIWEAHLDTPYTVKHFFEDLEGEDVENEDLREILTGKTDTQTQAAYKDVAGFSGKTLNQVNIDGNGKAIATVYYSRNSYTVTYDSKGGTPVDSQQFKYEETIDRPAITRDGYTFKGWSGAITMPAEDTGLVANWEVKDNTHYTVEHYQQNIIDDEYTIKDTEDKIGTTEADTAATGKNYPGFTMKPFDQQPISGNGNTVIKIYYDRSVYTLTFDTATGTDVDPITGRYGADIGTIPEPELSGYTFKGWENYPEGGTIPVGDRVLTAIWEANTGTAYTVEHYLQKLDGTYPETPNYTDNLSGTTDTQTNAVAMSLSGFTAQTFAQTGIKGDETTVVKIYYTRDTYTVSYQYVNQPAGASTLPASSGYLYEETVTVASWATAPGYDFVWSKTGTFSMPAENVVITGLFTARDDTPYTVEYYYQQANGTYLGTATAFTGRVAETDTIVYVTDQDKIPVESGYTFDASAANKLEGIVNGTGSLVLKVYFKKQFTVTYKPGNKGTFEEEVYTGLDYGKETPLFLGDKTQHLPGYTFSGWNPSVASHVTDNAIYAADWSANKDTPYTVIYTYEGTDDGILPVTIEIVYTGTTDTEVPAPLVGSGGFKDPDQQYVTILGDGSASVSYTYERTGYTLNYNTSGGTEVPSKTITYGALNDTGAITTRTGYTFVEWTGEERMPLDGTTLTAVWTPNTGTTYYVEHIYTGTNDGIDSVIETVTHSGTTDTRVTGQLAPRSGFITPEAQQVFIQPDGNGKLTYVYERTGYTLNYNTSGGTEVPSKTITYGALNDTGAITTRTGYTFVEWTGEERMPLDGTTLTAVWTPNTGTTYYVEHIYTGTNDGIDSVTETVTHSGTTDTRVTGQLAPRSGFITPEAQQVFIQPDGNGKLTYVYERDNYTLSYNSNGGTAVDLVQITYEALNDRTPRPTKTGYTFMSWSGAERMPLDGTTLEAIWDANTGTEYKVIHIYTGTNDGIDSETVERIWHGTSDATVTGLVEGRDGFISPEERTIYILPDGSASMTYVYERTGYTLNYNTSGGTEVPSKTIIYGALNDTGAVTTRTGYTFVKWTGEERMPLDGTTLTAVWTQNTGTTYYVEHYQENIDGTGYELVETDVLSGTTDTLVTPDRKDYEGFSAPGGVEINIDSDGNATVRYYYTRNSYNLKIKDRDEVIVDKDVKYGDVIELPADPSWTGHTFVRWSNVPEDGKMPANPVEIVAVWDTNTYTITFDADGGSEIAPIVQDYGTPITPPAAPSRDGYQFVGWDPELPETMPDHDMTVKAIWERNGRSGGGGRGGSQAADDHGAADDQPAGTGSDMSNVDPEVLAAYQWAYKNGITTIEGFENANPDGLIPRGHMAKMVTNFAVNVLGREIPSEIPAECSWGDTDWESEEIKDYAVKSCALGVMGIYMEDFLPNKILDRAELGTIISRLLWGDTYNVIDTNNRPYYVEHLRELKSEGIMTQIQNPEARKELRKWAWLMLMRVQQ